MNRKYMKWTDIDVELLEKVYPCEKKELILRMFPNRNWEHIRKKATALKIKRNVTAFRNINGTVEKLLLDELVSYYYMGFILADGHISTDFRLQLVISNLDVAWMDGLCEYLHTTKTVYNNTVGLRIRDTIFIPKIISKFDINPRKTYNPPNIERYKHLTNDQFLAIFIGFIDGDGYIGTQSNRTDCLLGIQCHSSWMSFMNMITSRLYDIYGFEIPIAKITKAGYAKMHISRNKILKELKHFSAKHDLPILSRKWDKIDLAFKSRTEIAYDKIETIKDAISNGKSLYLLSKETGWSLPSISLLVKRYNLR